MFSSSFTMSEQKHRQWTPYKHGAPPAAPDAPLVTPCSVPLRASRNPAHALKFE